MMRRFLPTAIIIVLLTAMSALLLVAQQQNFPPGGSGGASLTPSGGNQTITPSDTTSIPLTIKGAAATSVDLFDVVTSAGNPGLKINNLGTTFTFANGVISLTGWQGNNFRIGLAGDITGPVIIGARQITLGGDAFTHLQTNGANHDIAGTCTGSTTTCTVNFQLAFTSTPSCVITPTTAGVTSAIITSQSNSAFTITYAPSASTSFNYLCIGNPN
jgi:hypothetical protein